jgi:hypothetical protein
MEIDIAWGSHLPVLIKVLSLTDGDVLELGTGLYSTPFLHWACFQKRKLVSYDNNPDFLHLIKNSTGELHGMHLAENWDSINIEKPWDVVLVDHLPRGRRIEEIKRLAHWAKYVVIHDSQGRRDCDFHYSTIYHLFKYRYIYDRVLPHTTILSNFVDLTDFTI